MFLRDDHGLHETGGAAALSFGRAASALATPIAEATLAERLRAYIADTEWAPDLGAQIGSAEWWRGAASCAALITAACLLSPGFDRRIIGDVPAALSGAQWEEARASAIAPLALGGDTGRRMAATEIVVPLKETPERPIIELAATLGQGDSFARALERAGVSRGDARDATDLIAGAVPVGSVKAGTRLEMTLGRRPSRDVARPLERMAFRARFDLNLELVRSGDELSLIRKPIAVDNTPMRVQGLVGSSLYRSARAAGVPAKIVEAYIKAVATRVSIGREVKSSDSFDIIIEHARAATGEVQMGQLLYAGLNQGRKKVQLVRWGEGGGQWYEANGVGERRGTMGMPTAGRITSGYGLRRHPVLGFHRMHQGLDIAAPRGTPIYAANDGVVAFAGRNGGYGNFVKLVHAAGLSTGYGHMSRIAVRGGTRVSRGQVIGYVGSTGLSTGPHLHYEVWRNGRPINPRSVSFSTVAQLSGSALKAFKARYISLMAVRPGAK